MIAGWSPGVGDPTPIGWLTVVAYLAALAAALRAARRDVPANAGLWIGIAVFLGALAINKQFDLQTLLTAFAREKAHVEGWYESRRIVQQLFILGLAAGFGVLISWLFHLTRTRGRAVRTAIFGIALLSLFVCVRAASFHYMDSFLALSFLAMTANHFIELAGIAITGIAALTVRPRSPAHRPENVVTNLVPTD